MQAARETLCAGKLLPPNISVKGDPNTDPLTKDVQRDRREGGRRGCGRQGELGKAREVQGRLGWIKPWWGSLEEVEGIWGRQGKVKIGEGMVGKAGEGYGKLGKG